MVALYIRGSALQLFPFKSTIFSRLGRQSARLGLWEGGKSQRPTVGQIRDVKAYNVYGQMNVPRLTSHVSVRNISEDPPNDERLMCGVDKWRVNAFSV